MTDKIETISHSLMPFFKLIALVIGTWLLTFPILIWFYGKPLSAGEVGDMFGATNTLFSGLAFAGVIFAILLQRKEFELQRNQLELQRNELELTRAEFREQNETLKTQRFENTYFHMLTLHNELVESCNYDFYSSETNVSERINGREALAYIYSDFLEQCTTAGKRLFPSKNQNTPENINREYLEFYKKQQHNLGHYFRNMYNIVKFVKNSSVDDKRLYTNILRAQLSTHELALLFYNCASDMGKEKFKPLIEEFALLKNLPENILLNSEHKFFYSKLAFGTAL